MSDLTHFDADGKAHMVNVGDKPVTDRVAVACGEITMDRATLAKIREGGFGKGDVLGVARLAGIMGAKQTASLIPLCHPLGLDHVAVDLELDDSLPGVRLTATCRVTGRTAPARSRRTSPSSCCARAWGCSARRQHPRPVRSPSSTRSSSARPSRRTWM